MCTSDLSEEMRDLNPVERVKGDYVGEAEASGGCRMLVRVRVLSVLLYFPVCIS